MNFPESISKPKRDLYPERYKIHQYWSRKPWYVVKEYIQKFSNEGDSVLDPFSGSGVTACESLILKRRFFGADINPISLLITKLTSVSPIKLEKIESLFDLVLQNTEKKISDLYSTECRKCKKPVQIINTIWKGGIPTKIFYDCTNCKIKNLVSPNTQDLTKNKQILKSKFSKWYPKNIKLSLDSDVTFVDELFTKRNLLALSMIFAEINHLPASYEKETILLMFLSTLVRCSKLIFVNKHRYSKGVNPAGVWGEKRFWIPDEFIENNVLHYFSVRLKKILKAKNETNKLIDNFFSEETFNLHNTSATNLNFLENNSIDYCFTDPPYGGSVHYLDLSIIWNSWLQTKISENEIVISKSKTIQQYDKSMKDAIKEIYRVLKPHKFLTITFHNSEIKIWNILLNACKESGFDLKNIISQQPQKISHNQFDMDGSVRTDMILTFQKPKHMKKPIKRERNIKIIELTKNIIAQMFVTKKKVLLSEIYDSLLIHWIMSTYQSNLEQKFPSLKDVEHILHELKIKDIEEIETD